MCGRVSSGRRGASSEGLDCPGFGSAPDPDVDMAPVRGSADADSGQVGLGLVLFVAGCAGVRLRLRGRV